MNKLLIVLCLVLFGCNTDCPECPECPEPIPCDSCCPECEVCEECPECPQPPVCGENESCQCIDGYERDDNGDCIETEVPPGPQPQDYITIKRAGNVGIKCVLGSGLLKELCFDEQALIWDGIRNPKYALKRCCDKLPGNWPITIEVENGVCTSPEVELNREVFTELQDFMERLSQTNKRCVDDNEFCEHTNVRKSVFKDWRATRLEPAMNLAGQLNGIKSWCRQQ